MALPSLDTISLQVSVVLGRARMPIHKLLRLGRGAVIELATQDNDEVEILANDLIIARGQVVVSGNRIQIEVTSLVGAPPPAQPAHPQTAAPDQTLPDQTLPDQTLPDQTLPDQALPDQALAGLALAGLARPDQAPPIAAGED